MAASDDNSTEELFSFDVVVKYSDRTPAIGALVHVCERFGFSTRVMGDQVTVYADAEGTLPFPDKLRPDPETGLVQGYLPRGDYWVVINPQASSHRRTVMPIYVPERIGPIQ